MIYKEQLFKEKPIEYHLYRIFENAIYYDFKIRYIEINSKNFNSIPSNFDTLNTKFIINDNLNDCELVINTKDLSGEEFKQFDKVKKKQRIIESLDRLDLYSSKDNDSGIDIEKVKQMVKLL